MAEAFDVLLRIRHPSLDPDEITAQLGLVPEHQWKAGDERPATDGPRGHYAESYWVAPVQFPVQGEDHPYLESTLALAAAILKRQKAIWDPVRSEGQAELLVTLYSKGDADINLSTEVMSMLGGIGLSISIETESNVAAA
jgi:hypothetical protein